MLLNRLNLMRLGLTVIALTFTMAKEPVEPPAIGSIAPEGDPDFPSPGNRAALAVVR